MTAVLDDKDLYLAHFSDFEKSTKQPGPAWLQKLRQAAIERFAALGFPTLDDEEWRFTPLAALTAVPFEPGPQRHELTTGNLPVGVIVCSMHRAVVEHGDLVQRYLARFADYEEQPFVALNTAFIQDGNFIYLPRNAVVDVPIELTSRTERHESRKMAAHPRCLIVAEPNSQATIVERFAGPDGQVYFTNAVTEVVLGEGAIIDHYKVQQEGNAAFHIHTLQVQHERCSKFSSHSIGFGGRLTRNDINAYLGGEGCECTLNGLYLGNGQQLIDNHTRIDHAKPHCASHEVYKGILDGKAHGVFNGKIHVHPDAQKTDAKQTNQTLLLSDDAIINTKPQLEIYADDVKCTHGATVGQLDAESLFYLRSRGIPKDAARSLLTFAFANDIIGRIKIESLRTELEEILVQASGGR